MRETEVDKKHWSRPNIKQVRSGSINTYGKKRNLQWQDNIEGISIKSLIKDYGSPLFVLSEKRLRHNIRSLKRAFSSRYPHVLFGWSYKTNYLGAVCNILHQEGATAEVVSTFEYHKARKLGVPGDQILFNGPAKNRDILKQAITEKASIHIDHFDELHLIEDIVNQRQEITNIGIRLNLDTGVTEHWHRFGFNIESGQALDAVRRITKNPLLKLTGLHSHLGTFIVDTRAYEVQIKKMCDFMHVVEDTTECHIEYIDIGGGFASMNQLQGIYLPPEKTVPSVDQYADTICNTLLEETQDRTSSGIQRPLLVLETGRAVVDDAEVLLSSVLANKLLPDGRRAVVVDAGINLLFTSFWYNHTITPTRSFVDEPEETMLYGPLCMNIDVVRHSVHLPPLKVGDTVMVSPVGAYNNTQWLQFIEYRPNVVMVHEDNQVSVIRHAENLEYIDRQERIPQHLANPFLNKP